MCGNSSLDGPLNVIGQKEWMTGDYLCQISLPSLKVTNVGYFLTSFVDTLDNGVVRNRLLAARFLEATTWGPSEFKSCTRFLSSRLNIIFFLALEEISNLESEVGIHGTKALANWIHNQVRPTPTSHRALFRKRLNPPIVESYQNGVPTWACEKDARWRQFTFTYKDVELSRGYTGNRAGNNGLPFTPMRIMTDGGLTIIKFGDDIRTILDYPLQYDDGNSPITLSDGDYTICSAEEVLGMQIGNETYHYQFQVLVGDVCTSSYTDRGGTDDFKGDGSRECTAQGCIDVR